MVNDSLTKIIKGVEHEPNWVIHFDKNKMGKRGLRYEMIWVPLTAKRKEEMIQAKINRDNYNSKKPNTTPNKGKWIPNKYNNNDDDKKYNTYNKWKPKK